MATPKRSRISIEAIAEPGNYRRPQKQIKEKLR